MTNPLQSPQAGGGLLPCPFCGCTPEPTKGRYVFCGSCTADGPYDETDPNGAWNRRASTPAPSGLAGEAVAKPLEWNEYDDEQGNPGRWDAEAAPFGVFYSVEMQHDGFRVVFDHEAVGAVGVFDTLSEAKAAAQRDFETRILSALER